MGISSTGSFSLSKATAEALTAAVTPLAEYVARAATNNEVKEVLQYVEDINAFDRHERRDPQGRSLMHFAAAASSTTLMEELVRMGFPLDTVDFNGVHPLHVAAAAGHLQHVLFMLERGVPACLCDGFGGSAISRASESNARAVIECIAQRGGDEEAVEEFLAQRACRPFVDRTMDLHLLWHEAEGIVRLRVATTLYPLPWDNMPKLSVACALFAGPPQQIAGLLMINGEYQFNCSTFAPGVKYNSPHTTGMQVVVYQSLDSPYIAQVFSFASRNLCLLRCYDSSGLEPEKTQAIAKQRVPDVEEKAQLTHLPKESVHALLSRSIPELDYAASMIIRVFRWGRTLKRFRRVIWTLTSCVAIAKRFLRSRVRARKFALLVLRTHLSEFEKYAKRELVQIKSSSFPAMHKALLHASYDPETIVTAAIERRKHLYIEAVRSGKPTIPFTYLITLSDICPVWVEKLDVKEIALALHTKSSFLPRAMLVALARSAGSGAHEQIARSRFLSVLLELVTCYRNRESYAEQFLRGISIAGAEETTNFLQVESEEAELEESAPRNSRKSVAPSRLSLAGSAAERNAAKNTDNPFMESTTAGQQLLPSAEGSMSLSGRERSRDSAFLSGNQPSRGSVVSPLVPVALTAPNKKGVPWTRSSSAATQPNVDSASAPALPKAHFVTFSEAEISAPTALRRAPSPPHENLEERAQTPTAVEIAIEMSGSREANEAPVDGEVPVAGGGGALESKRPAAPRHSVITSRSPSSAGRSSGPTVLPSMSWVGAPSLLPAYSLDLVRAPHIVNHVLICDATSPIPRLVGTRNALRQMLMISTTPCTTPVITPSQRPSATATSLSKEAADKLGDVMFLPPPTASFTAETGL